MQDAGCRVHAGCRVQGAGCRVQGSPSTRCRTAIQAADSAVAGTTPGVWKVVSAKANDGKSPLMIRVSGKISTSSLETTLTSLLSATETFRRTAIQAADSAVATGRAPGVWGLRVRYFLL